MLLVIDGIDAAGKSTQALKLSNYLEKQGKTVFLRVHPSQDNWFGVKTKRFLFREGKSVHFASALFYMLDVIRSILLYSWRKYDYVIFVRYLMGTAYLPSPASTVAYHFFAAILPRGKVMFFLDVTPEEAYRRICQTRKNREMFESLKRLEQVRRKAYSLASMNNWTVIDANEPINTVEKEIRKLLRCS